MGFEDYVVLIESTRTPEFWMDVSGRPLTYIREEIAARWPSIHTDNVELAHLQYPPSPEQLFLCSHTSGGLFQILVSVGNSTRPFVVVSLRFAYCNPRTVYEPFCAFIEWLMDKWSMSCTMMREPAPEQGNITRTMGDPREVRPVLIPSMDYHRKLWRLDAGTEEAILRPHEAINRFITPHLIPLPKRPE